MDDKLKALQQAAIFADLDDKSLEALARVTDRVAVKAGRVLMTEGEVVTHMYIMIDGSASVHVDGNKVADLGPGRVIGELSMVDDKPSSATVVIDEPSHLWLVPRAGFLPVWEDNPEMSVAMLRAVVRKLRATDELLHN